MKKAKKGEKKGKKKEIEKEKEKEGEEEGELEEEEENEEEETIQVKAILLGETGVGKTNLSNSIVDLRFDPNSKATVNSLYIQKKMNIFGKDFEIRLWDTAGQEQYRALTKLFYQDSKVVVFVYDITNKTSFTELNYWINEIKESLGDEPVLGVVGNKSDMEELKEVSDDVAEKFAKEHGMELKLLSIKEDPKSFKIFLRKLVKEYISKKFNINENNSFNLESNHDMDNHGSCLLF